MPNEYGKGSRRSINRRHAIITTARERGYRTYKKKPYFKLVAKVETDTPN